MEFKPSNADDISRYYRDSYVKLEEFGDQLFYVESVSTRSVQGKTETGEVFEIILDETRPYPVEYVLPKKSYFQNGKHAFLLQRIPAKQYQRGLSGHNTSIKRLRKDGAMIEAAINFDNLNKYVGKKAFPNFREAVGNKEKLESVALSSRFAYCNGTLTIHLDALAVATVSKQIKRVTMLQPIFKPEVVELCQNSGYEVI